MNIEETFTVLHREQLLIDHAPHSVQFQHLTECLLRAFSAASAIPALSEEEIELYSALALLHDIGKRTIPPEQAGDMIVTGACGAFAPLLLACFARHIGEIYQAVYG